MFTLLKLIKPFLLPPTLIALGMAASLYLLFRGRHRMGRVLLVAVLTAYYLLSIGPVAYILAQSLERKMGTGGIEVETENVEAIVVLSAGASKKGGYRTHHQLSGSAWKRFWHGVEVYKELEGRIPILYVGGSGNPFDPVSVEAELAKRYAVSIGIPGEKFWVESGARDTYESGVAIKRILDERYPAVEGHRIIVVTSALHMLRSIKVMEKAGLYPIPSPADFAVGSLDLDPLSFFPSVGNFFVSTRCINEWLGIVGYKLLGRI